MQLIYIASNKFDYYPNLKAPLLQLVPSPEGLIPNISWDYYNPRGMTASGFFANNTISEDVLVGILSHEACCVVMQPGIQTEDRVSIDILQMALVRKLRHIANKYNIPLTEAHDYADVDSSALSLA